VVPAWNEAPNLPEFCTRVGRVLEQERDLRYELIIVDDGSTDTTLDVLRRLRAGDKRIRFFSLSRNFGHQAALTAGLDRARGDAIIFMDADLQHPPEVIPELIRRWRAGAQVVNTVRRTDERLPFFKRWGTAAFYWLINLLSDTRIEVNAADFRLLDRRPADTLRQLQERARFLRGLVSWMGFRQTTVEFRPDQRFAGQTKYSFRKMLRLAMDGIFSFSTVPLRFVSWLGAIACVAALLETADALYVKLFTGAAVQGWTSTLIVVLFLGGSQMLAMGIFGAYLGNVYAEARQRPVYVINDSSDDEEASVLLQQREIA
jgi:dolichol-phosphate mannosyltransferase